MPACMADAGGRKTVKQVEDIESVVAEFLQGKGVVSDEVLRCLKRIQNSVGHVIRQTEKEKEKQKWKRERKGQEPKS